MMNRFDRQSFLGKDSQKKIESSKIAIIGLGGGGSHIVQQLAHIGFKHYVILDPDRIEDTNLNRLIGATIDDVDQSRYKIEIAQRVLKNLCPDAKIEAFPNKWQEQLNALKKCDIIFGCIDSFIQRRDLEGFSRRYLIPYIDIGMDVHSVPDCPPRIAGQIILSMSGCVCMQCMGYLTEKTLAIEGTRYGDAGSHPQVVWCNGVLASTAVGLAVDLITNWSSSLKEAVFLSYDGNTNTISPDNRWQYIKNNVCPHYSLENVGEVK
jgi:hypothetical protein